MVMTLGLLGALLLTAAPTAGAVERRAAESRKVVAAFDNLVFDSRVEGQSDLGWLRACGRVPSCGGSCQATLDALRGSRPLGQVCAPLAPLTKGSEGRARAAAWARPRLLEEAKRVRPGLELAARDTLDCALARLEAGPVAPEACARDEARRLHRGLGLLVRHGAGQGVYPALCSELDGCAGACAGELRVSNEVAWEARTAGVLAAQADERGSCPEFAAVMRAGKPEDAGERAVSWAQRRIVAFATRSCPLLGPDERAEVACRLVQLGLGAPGAVCGAVPSTCTAPASKR
jgi:hypothetical protein